MLQQLLGVPAAWVAGRGNQTAVRRCYSRGFLSKLCALPYSCLLLLRPEQLLAFAHHVGIRSLALQVLLLLLELRQRQLCWRQRFLARDLNDQHQQFALSLFHVSASKDNQSSCWHLVSWHHLSVSGAIVLRCMLGRPWLLTGIRD